MNSQKFDTSSLQGQKQLIDLGKTLENVREIEEIRSQKENDLDEYFELQYLHGPDSIHLDRGKYNDEYVSMIQVGLYIATIVKVGS